MLSSWIVRLSVAHGMKTHVFCRFAFPGIQVWNRDIDKSCPDALIEKIAALTSTDIQIAKDTTLKYYEGKLYLSHNYQGINKWILNAGVYHRKRNRNWIVFCPKCLSKDGNMAYFRKNWRLSFSVCCTSCGLVLQDCCPGCKNPVLYFRVGMGKGNRTIPQDISICTCCGYDLRKSPQVKASRIFIRCQKMLERISVEGWKKDVLYPHLFFDVFYTLLGVLRSKKESSQKLRNYFTKNWPDLSYDSKYIYHQSFSIFENLPIEIRRVLVLQTYSLFLDWPERFIGLMTYHGLHTMDLSLDYTGFPFWYESLIKENFFMSNVNRRFIKLNVAIKDNLRNRFETYYVLRLNRPFSFKENGLCPSCHSDSIIKYGNQLKRQRYCCNYCLRTFTETGHMVSYNLCIYDKKNNLNAN